MDKISVIIPVYNVEKYIAECLESVINQTYKNLEIICVDDCGSDNSMKIVQDYAKKDSRIKIIRHEKNRGLAPARNTGLDAAEGSFIFFLDSDDYILPDILEKMYNKIESTNSDFVNSSSKAFADNPDDIELVKKAEKADLTYRGTDGYCITTDNLEITLNNMQCLAWGKLFRARFLKENNLKFINQNVTFEDNGFFIKLISCYPTFSTMKNIGVMYRINSSSITSCMDRQKNRKKKMMDVESVMNEALEYIAKKDNGKKTIEIIKNAGTYSWYFKKKSSLFFDFVWGKYNKKLVFFALPLIRGKVLNKDTKIVKILGIPVSYSKIEDSIL